MLCLVVILVICNLTWFHECFLPIGLFYDGFLLIDRFYDCVVFMLTIWFFFHFQKMATISSIVSSIYIYHVGPWITCLAYNSSFFHVFSFDVCDPHHISLLQIWKRFSCAVIVLFALLSIM